MCEKDDGMSETGIDILFREARTYSAWQNKEIDDGLLHSIYDLLKMAPTSANCSPARFKFIRSDKAKERLKPHLAAGNVDQTMSAPVCVIIANDRKFYEHLPKLYPHTDAKSWFEGYPEKIDEASMLNGSLQGAYLIMAARALGLDCGPMSGFDKAGVKDVFFPDDDVDVNFLCNIGTGDKASLYERSPRFNFDDVCEVL